MMNLRLMRPARSLRRVAERSRQHRRPDITLPAVAMPE
jgi:hypothetical protein